MPQIILDFATQEAMDTWKAHSMWDMEDEPSPFGNEPDARELEMEKYFEDNMTITEVE